MNQIPPSYKSELPLLETSAQYFIKSMSVLGYDSLSEPAVLYAIYNKLLRPARFEVLTVTLLWIQVFWDYDNV
jgi:hypothetical protein